MNIGYIVLIIIVLLVVFNWKYIKKSFKEYIQRVKWNFYNNLTTMAAKKIIKESERKNKGK